MNEVIIINKSETSKEELADFYNRFGLKGTAEEFGIKTVPYMEKLLEKYGILTPRKRNQGMNAPIPNDKQEEILRLYHLGRVVGTICNRTGISRARIRKFLEEQGIEVGAGEKVEK